MIMWKVAPKLEDGLPQSFSGLPCIAKRSFPQSRRLLLILIEMLFILLMPIFGNNNPEDLFPFRRILLLQKLSCHPIVCEFASISTNLESVYSSVCIHLTAEYTCESKIRV